MARNKGSQNQEPNLEYYVGQSIDKRRAAEFQAGLDPLHRTAFEERLCQLEKENRWKAKKEYIRGVQGEDGGACHKEEQTVY